MKKNWILFVSLVFIIQGCALRIRTHVSPSVRLGKFNKIYLRSPVGAGAISGSGARVGGLVSGSVMSGNPQVRIAFEQLQFELMSIGFDIVDSEHKADAIVEFTIGTVRYDALAGWIADRGLVKFIDGKSGQMIAFYQAETQLVTPTVSNIVETLGRAIQKDY